MKKKRFPRGLKNVVLENLFMSSFERRKMLFNTPETLCIKMGNFSWSLDPWLPGVVSSNLSIPTGKE